MCYEKCAFVFLFLCLCFFFFVFFVFVFFFFFQAEDGIRDIGVTGVQTCALPILSPDTSSITVKTRVMQEGLVNKTNMVALGKR